MKAKQATAIKRPLPYVIKTKAGGALVTVETATGVHISTVSRATAIARGLIKPDKIKSR